MKIEKEWKWTMVARNLAFTFVLLGTGYILGGFFDATMSSEGEFLFFNVALNEHIGRLIFGMFIIIVFLGVIALLSDLIFLICESMGRVNWTKEFEGGIKDLWQRR